MFHTFSCFAKIKNLNVGESIFPHLAVELSFDALLHNRCNTFISFNLGVGGGLEACSTIAIFC